MELLLPTFLFGGLTMIVASRRGLPLLTWFLYGALIFPVAIVHVFFARPDSVSIAVRANAQRQCPACAEVVRVDAKVCKHCGRDLPALAPAPREPTRAWSGSSSSSGEMSMGRALLLMFGVALAAGAGAWWWIAR